MERTTRVQIWAGASMLVLCLLIGGVEGATVLGVGSWAVFVPWLVVFLSYLAALVVATTRATPATGRGRLLLVAAPVLLSSALVLLSPNRGGFSYILLVLGAAIASLHLDLRGIVAVVGWNTVVVLAVGAGLGPLVERGTPPMESLLMAFLYALLQGASAAMVWSQQRVEEALQELTATHVELRGAGVLLAESSQAQERLRISRELHDVLGHQLTVLSVELEVAAHRAEGPARDHVLRARELAGDLLADVRSVVGTERRRRFDLAAALIQVTADVPRPRVHLEVAADLDVDDDRALALVRAVQEVATNTIRHAQAENLWITVAEDDGAVRLEAHDDGRGAARVEPGNGLHGLRERAAALGGRVAVDGGDGFRVRVELPAREGAPA